MAPPFHITQSHLDGFLNAEPKAVRQVVRHLLSGCEQCSGRVTGAIGAATRGISLRMVKLPPLSSSRGRRSLVDL